MSCLAGKKTIGYKKEARQLLLTASLSKPPYQHEVQYFWNIAQFACQYWFPALAWPNNIPTHNALSKIIILAYLIQDHFL